MMKMEIDGRVAARGETKVSFPAKKTAEFLNRSDTLPKLNPEVKSVKELRVIKNEPYDIFVDYQIWPVSDRDFINIFYMV